MAGEAFDCEGAPRDLGLDQGRACRAELRRAFGAESWWNRCRLWAGHFAAPTVRVARDVARHFPRQSETLEGIAVGAGVPFAWLVERLDAEFESAPLPALAVQVAAGGSWLARAHGGPVRARRRRPEGGFRSLELVRPWLGAALAGVNECGLAAVAVAGSSDAADCAAPSGLLIQDCLERFERVDAALDWCVGRPCGYAATLLMADIRGDVAGVVCAADGRRVLRPADGLLVAEVPGAHGDLAKRLRESAPLDPASVALAAPPLSVVALDPTGRRLGVDAGTPGLRWLDV